jgi:myo-inositol-1(or 4)-monophosphatase
MLAGKLLIEEAGGRVSRFDGRPLGLGSDEIVASNGVLHAQLLEILGDQAAAQE